MDSDAHALEVRAGAGTGKTHTLAHRVARLAPDPRSQRRVLVVTFTREATASLARRLSLLLGRDHEARVVSFHQWAARELPREERRFLADGDARRILLRALARRSAPAAMARALGAPAGEADELVARVSSFLGYAKNAEASVGQAIATQFPHLAPWQGALEDLADAYEEGKGDRLDYDDLLLRFRDLLKRSASFRQEVQARLDHVLVDEYQDVNGIQAETVRLVTARDAGSPRVTIVGDPRQSIYAFRGGGPEHMARFLRAYRGRGERVALTVSFRSGRRVLQAANAVLPDRHPLRARKGAPRAEPPRLVACPDAAAEARVVADHVERLLAAGADPAEVVVLARSRGLAAGYQEEALQRRAAEAWADEHPDAMGAAVDAWARGEPRPATPREAARAWGVLERRARAAPLPASPTARDLLALPRGLALPEVRLSTIHAAKGLEWDHVVLLGAREGGLPSEQAVNAPADAQRRLLEEERRLLYVALTRARRSVLVTWPESGPRRAHAPSRFLAPLLEPPAPVAPARARAEA